MSTVNIDTSASGYYQSIVSQANAAQRTVNRIQMAPKLDPKGFVQPLGRITNSASEFQKSMDASAARVFAFGAAVGVINGISDSFKALISSAAEVEKSLKDIQVVMEATNRQMAEFGQGIFDVARNTASSFRTVAESATELARQGLSAEETLARVNSALILSRLSGLGAVKSTETLTAAINSFNKEGVTHEQVVNRMANVDAAFAVSSADLAEAISRAGAVAQSSGVEFNELAAIVTAVQQRTARGGSVIGNGFKSIFTRIKRSSVREALEEIGVATEYVDGTFRSGIDIIKDYADAYKNLSDEQKAATSEQIAGVFQIQNLQALIQDLNSGFSVYNRALEVANKTTNEATRRNEDLNTTLSALFSQTSTSAKELAASIGDLAFSDSFKEILTFLNNLAQSINGLFSESEGSNIAKTLVQGIGKFLTGPGLVIIGAAFIKIFALVGKFARDAVADLLGLNRESKRQQSLQMAISQILATNEKLYAKILAASGNSAKQEQIILGVIKQATAERQKQEAIIKRIAASSKLMGIGAGEQGFIPVGNKQQRAVGKKTLRMSQGFLPAMNREQEDIAAGIGGARKNDKAIKTKINVAPGRKIDAVVNSGEYLVKNFQGSGADAVFNRDMARQYGLPSGAKKFNAASGLIPNFSGGLKLNLSSGQKITIREGQKVNEETLDDWIKDGAGVMTDFGFLSARQAGQAGAGNSVIPWQLQGSPYSPEKYWTKGERVSINKGALGGFKARNSKENLEKQKQEREKKRTEMPTIDARSKATMLISQRGVSGLAQDRIYKGADGVDYRMLYNVYGLNLNGLKTGEKKLQERIGGSMIKQADLFADEVSGTGKFARSNAKINKLTTPGSVGAAAGTIFETGLRAISDNKLFSQNIGDTFDIIRRPDAKLKKLFGNYDTKYGDAKINADPGNLRSFHKKLYTFYGSKAKKEAGIKSGKKTFSRGFLPKFTSFMPSFAGGFIPNFAKGETNKQQIERLKKAQRAARKAGNATQANELGKRINALKKTQTSNQQRNKKQAQKARQRSGGQVGSTFSVDFNKNSGAASAPVSDETRAQRTQNRMAKRIRREYRRMLVRLSRGLQAGSKKFSGAMNMASMYGSEGISRARGALGNLSGKVGEKGRLAASKISAAATGGAQGLKDWIQERKNISERAKVEKQAIRERNLAIKQQEKQVRLEISRREKFLKQQEKLSKSEERARRSAERNERVKRRIAGVVTSATSNTKIIGQQISKAIKSANIKQRVSSGISGSTTAIGGLTSTISKGLKVAAEKTASKVAETSQKVKTKTSEIGAKVKSAAASISPGAAAFGASARKILEKTVKTITPGPSVKVDPAMAEAERLERQRIQDLKDSERARKILEEKEKKFSKKFGPNPYSGLDPENKSDRKRIFNLNDQQKAYEKRVRQGGMFGMFRSGMSPERRAQGRSMRGMLGSPGSQMAGAFVLPMIAQAIEGDDPSMMTGTQNMISSGLMGASYGLLLGGKAAAVTGIGGLAKGAAEYNQVEDRRGRSIVNRNIGFQFESQSNKVKSIDQFSQALQQIELSKTNNDVRQFVQANKDLQKSLQGINDPKLLKNLNSIAMSTGDFDSKLLNLSKALEESSAEAARLQARQALGSELNKKIHDGSIFYNDNKMVIRRDSQGKEFAEFQEAGFMDAIGNMFNEAWSFSQSMLGSAAGATAEMYGYDALGAVLRNTGPILQKYNANREDVFLGNNNLAGSRNLAQTFFNDARASYKGDDGKLLKDLQEMQQVLFGGNGAIGGSLGNTSIGKNLEKVFLDRMEELLSGGGIGTVKDSTFGKDISKELQNTIDSIKLSMNASSEMNKELASTVKKMDNEMKALSPAVQNLTQAMLANLNVQRQAELAMFAFNKNISIGAAQRQGEAQRYNNRTSFLMSSGSIENSDAIRRNNLQNRALTKADFSDQFLSESTSLLSGIDLSALTSTGPKAPAKDADDVTIAQYEVAKKIDEQKREVAQFYKDFIDSNKDGNIGISDISGAMISLEALSRQGNSIAETYFSKLSMLQETNNSILKEELRNLDSTLKFEGLEDKLAGLAAAGSSLGGASDILSMRDLARDYKGRGSRDAKSVMAARGLASQLGIPVNQFTGLSEDESNFIVGNENLKRFSSGIGNSRAKSVIDDYRLKLRRDSLDIRAERNNVSEPRSFSSNRVSPPAINRRSNYRTNSMGMVEYTGDNPYMKNLYSPRQQQGMGSVNIGTSIIQKVEAIETKLDQTRENLLREAAKSDFGFRRPVDYVVDSTSTKPMPFSGPSQGVPTDYSQALSPIPELSTKISSLDETNKQLSENTQKQIDSSTQQSDKLETVNQNLTSVSESTEKLGNSVSEFSTAIESTISSSSETLNSVNSSAESFASSTESVNTSIQNFVEKVEQSAEVNKQFTSQMQALTQGMSQVNENITGFPETLKTSLESVVMQMQVTGKIDLNFNTEIVRNTLGPVMYEKLKEILAKPMILDYLSQQLGGRIRLTGGSNF